ncbi:MULTISPECIES: hypothetical protein [Nostocales]|uniref:Uncharacterized protein n=3 Tax=Nostocales TaxID=1161 RepID=A0A8S9T9N4_9CYAN|nr:hypothetical protein [Tolypothrix bouteillei]KAF3888856.1 hypothetical protein DA73_0400027750 [Tolypothrix bouteillei VB521301]
MVSLEKLGGKSSAAGGFPAPTGTGEQGRSFPRPPGLANKGGLWLIAILAISN